MPQSYTTRSADHGPASWRLPGRPFTRSIAAQRGMTPLQIRALDDHDLPVIERHLLALDSLSRRARFGSAFADTSVVAYVRRTDLKQALLMGAVDRTDGLVGLAEAQPTTSPLRVEMAVSVLEQYRHCGLGGYLVSRTMSEAFSRGFEIADFLFARDNQAIVGLIRAVGGRFTALDRAEIRAATPAHCGIPA